MKIKFYFLKQIKYVYAVLIVYITKIKKFFYSFYSYKHLDKILDLIQLNRIEKRYFSSGRTYTRSSSESKLLFSESITRMSSSPIFKTSEFKNGKMQMKYQESISYGALIKNAQIIGGSSLILTDGKTALYDIKFDKTNNNYSYTDVGIVYYKDDYCLVKNEPAINKIHNGILMSGNYSWNYYHLLFEFIVKFDEIHRLNIHTDIPILVDEICLKITQFQELFELFNKKHRKIIALKKGKRYIINELYHLSSPNFIVPNFIDAKQITATDTLLDSKTLDFLRTSLIPKIKNKNYPKKIFLSRKSASDRRKFNENEVIELLIKNGFEVIYIEQYTILEQVSIFNNAEFIIGGTGAAFTNIVYCDSNCKIICLTNYKLDLSIFSTIAKYLKIKMLYFVDKSKDMSKMKSIHDSFKIDINDLEKILFEWL